MALRSPGLVALCESVERLLADHPEPPGFVRRCSLNPRHVRIGRWRHGDTRPTAPTVLILLYVLTLRRWTRVRIPALELAAYKPWADAVFRHRAFVWLAG